VDDGAHGRQIRGIVMDMEQTPFQPVVRTQADLEQLWRRLMTPLGFTRCSLWMIVIEDERPVAQIFEFTDTPSRPGEDVPEALAAALEDVGASSNTSFAFLRSRPGAGRPDPDDLAWAHTLYDVGRLAGVRVEVTHLAHDDDVIPLPMDDLLAEPA
jgi:hypothetical protein